MSTRRTKTLENSPNRNSLSSCANGAKGKQLLVAAGKRTGSHMYVPWVQINGAHSSAAEDNLINAVCKACELWCI